MSGLSDDVKKQRLFSEENRMTQFSPEGERCKLHSFTVLVTERGCPEMGGKTKKYR